MRTKHDPKKWPILDKGELGEPPQIIPVNSVNSLTNAMQDYHFDNLNPDVAEFVPHSKRLNSKKGESSSDEKIEQNGISANEENGDEDNWREVKRKSKESKGKKETKAKNFEREELDFHFDEEVDEVPAARQNTFTTDW